MACHQSLAVLLSQQQNMMEYHPESQEQLAWGSNAARSGGQPSLLLLPLLLCVHMRWPLGYQCGALGWAASCGALLLMLLLLLLLLLSPTCAGVGQLTCRHGAALVLLMAARVAPFVTCSGDWRNMYPTVRTAPSLTQRCSYGLLLTCVQR